MGKGVVPVVLLVAVKAAEGLGSEVADSGWEDLEAADLGSEVVDSGSAVADSGWEDLEAVDLGSAVVDSDSEVAAKVMAATVVVEMDLEARAEEAREVLTVVRTPQSPSRVGAIGTPLRFARRDTVHRR